MRVEIPECKRCCCFVPLRYGIIVIGYLNLLFSLLVLSLETWLATINVTSRHTLTLYRGVTFYSQMWFAVLLYTLDVIFNIIMLIGAHRKKRHLLRAFFYYGITTILSSFVIFLVVKCHEIQHNDWYNTIFEGAFVFCEFVLHTYLLLLVRSELRKLRQNSQLNFVNHAAEVTVDVHHWGEGRNPL